MSDNVKEIRLGRPPYEWTEEIKSEILDKITSGRSLISILKSTAHYPSYSMFCRFLESNEIFREQYARAKQEQSDYLAEEILEIADDGTNDTMIDEKGNPRCNNEWVQRSKLRVETRKWIASKLKPKKYGDKVLNEHSGVDGSNFVVTIASELAKL